MVRVIETGIPAAGGEKKKALSPRKKTTKKARKSSTMTALATFVRSLYVLDDSSRFFPFTPDDNVTTEEENEMSLVTIHQYLELIIKSLHRMLGLSFMHFVSHMIHNDSLHVFLTSYFAHRQRPNCLSHSKSSQLDNITPRVSIAAGQCHVLLKEMDKLVYLLYLRMVSVSDLNNNSSSSSSSGTIITTNTSGNKAQDDASSSNSIATISANTATGYQSNSQSNLRSNGCYRGG